MLADILRRGYRRLIWKGSDPYRYFETAPELPAHRLVSAKLYPVREQMLGALPKGGTVAEVGVDTGYFSKRILATCRPDDFHLIDIDFTATPADIPGTRHEGDSSTILRSFEPDFFDWLYIDGDHRYAGVAKDLAAAHNVVKPGGYLMCNDYTNFMSLEIAPYGVMRAVNEFIIERGYSVEGLAFSPYGNHDLLIRKPR